ncbi:MAG: hypothetical protein ACJAVN_000887 [Roseivirga sp.]|jgi:hypothetical protein
MTKEKDHSYSLTRGLGGLFIFASFEFLENDQFLWMLIAMAVGIINMLPYFWKASWSSIVLYGINAVMSAIVFYRFIQLDTRYIQWLWLAIGIYYIIRLRHLFKKHLTQQEVGSDSVPLPIQH